MIWLPGPAFGATLIGAGIAWMLFKSGQPLHSAVAGGLTVAVLDYVILVWLKSRGIEK